MTQPYYESFKIKQNACETSYKFIYFINKNEANQKTFCKVLNTLSSLDQRVRFLYLKQPEEKIKLIIEEIDAINTNFLKKIYSLDKRIINNLFFEKNENENCLMSIWILAQHSTDISFQILFLQLLKKNLKYSQKNKQYYAYLYDRIALKTKKKQLYGTQVMYENFNKKWVIKPVEDEVNLEKRRTLMGLEPVNEYLDSVSQLYKGLEENLTD